MARVKFLWQLYAGYVVLVLISTSAVGLLITSWLERDLLADVDQALDTHASLLAEVVRPTLSRGGVIAPEDEARLGAIGREVGTRFAVLDGAARLLAHSHGDVEPRADMSTRPEVVAARDHGVGRAVRRSDAAGGEPLLFVARRLDGPVAGAPLGYVRAALPLGRLEARLDRFRLVVLVGTVLIALLALTPGLVVVRRISEPLAAMTEVARSIAEGNYQPKLPEPRPDEMGTLARAFSAMAGQLRDRMDTITSDRNKLAAILGSMVEGVVAVDREARVVHANDVAARLLTTTARDAIGRRIEDVSRHAEIAACLKRALDSAAPGITETQVPGPPRDQTVELHAAPLRDSSGQTAGAVVMIHDITELRRLETVRREFVANVSHELKTPLTAIVGLIETMIDDPDMEAPTKGRFLEKVLNQSNRLGTLVRDLLTLSRVESEDGSLERRALDLREPLGESFRSLQLKAEERSIGLETEVPDGAVTVTGDREALRQVVDNLLDNALKYTPAGGRVVVRLRRDEQRAILEVQDTGIGIGPEDRERVFERFYRVDKARSRDLGGTGLGLSIVKHVALAHDGQVAVESELGTGSTFRVTLPLAGASTSSGRIDSPQAA